MTQSAMKDAIQHQFRVNDGETDPRIADMLCSKGEMELEETLLYFKQKAHLLRILNPESESSAVSAVASIVYARLSSLTAPLSTTASGGLEEKEETVDPQQLWMDPELRDFFSQRK